MSRPAAQEPHTGGPSTTTVDIVLSVHNGGPWLAPQIESIRAQTHRAWRLWIRDDGSDDESWEVARKAEEADPRIHLHPRDGERLGAGPAFGRILEGLPSDARYIFTSDADDVWIPEKVEVSLAAFRREERGGAPLLLHTDLAVVDPELRILKPSLWDLLGIRPEPATLRRLLVQNVLTGPTLLLNRPLVEAVLPIPREAIFQDWWIGLVAAAVGRIAALPTRTVLYRRHGANSTGEYPLRRGVGRAGEAWGRRKAVRRWIDATAAQAGALLERHGGALPPEERAWLEGHASIRDAGGVFRRKRLVARHMTLPEYGAVKNLGIVARG